MIFQALLALWFGLLSAVSLPLGAWLGLWARPRERITAGIMAFGGGALLAALTLELVQEALHHGGFLPLAIGCVLGAVTFASLNLLVNNYGGFLRKTSTLTKHVSRMKRRRVSYIIDRLSRVPILNQLPPEEIHAIVPMVTELSFAHGVPVIVEGAPGFEAYIVEEGRLEVTQKGNHIADLCPGDVFGEMALLEDHVRHATVTAKEAVKVLKINKHDFLRLLETSPQLKAEVKKIYETRKEDMTKKLVDAEQWASRARETASVRIFQPTVQEIKEVVAKEKEKRSVPLAIWLGALLDGIPESAVIGASLVGGAAVSLSLIAGIFLANFPESLSSAIGMRKMGMSFSRISWLWGSLCALTGFGAFIGNIAFHEAASQSVALLEGLAAGAMLAMLSETMMPEAYEHGGPIVGMATVLGFLSAIFVKTFE